MGNARSEATNNCYMPSLSRFTADGQIDSGFGVNGVVQLTDLSPCSSSATAVAVDSHAIYITGVASEFSACFGDACGIFLAKRHLDGSPDGQVKWLKPDAFHCPIEKERCAQGAYNYEDYEGLDGNLTPESATDIALTPAGEPVITGYAHFRRNLDEPVVEENWGMIWKPESPLPGTAFLTPERNQEPHTAIELRDLAFDASGNGNVLVDRIVDSPGSAMPSDAEIGVVGFDSKSMTFHESPGSFIPVPGLSNYFGGRSGFDTDELILQPDGRAVISSLYDQPPNQTTVARYSVASPTPVLDPNFGTAGVFRDTNPAHHLSGVALQGDRILLGGLNTLGRLTSTGTLDTTFGGEAVGGEPGYDGENVGYNQIAASSGSSFLTLGGGPAGGPDNPGAAQTWRVLKFSLATGFNGAPVGATSNENHPPIGRPESFVVQAGETIEAILMGNDYDPDGDAIHVKATQISFAHREWSGLEPDGTFFYTAGPGTARELRKLITYLVIDSHGAASRPTQAVVTIVPGKKDPKPIGKSGKVAARISGAAAPYWQGPFGSASLCFGGGLNSSCYTMNSVPFAADLNRVTGTFPSLGAAVKWCLKFNLIPETPVNCAKSVLKHGLSWTYDRSVLHNAAYLHECLLSRVHRHRTLMHPRSGAWSKPEYFSDDSLVSPWNGYPKVSGFGRWRQGGGHFSARWQVPLFCDAKGLVHRVLNVALTNAS